MLPFFITKFTNNKKLAIAALSYYLALTE